MQQIKAKIILKQKIKSQYYRLVLQAPGIAKNALPGEFINCKISDDCQPLLRRPLSIHRTRGNNLELLFGVVGKGTQILSRRKLGEYLDIIGPLGNGFNLRPTTYDLRPILVAGGMGVAPLIFLAEKLAEVKSQKSKVKSLVFIGAKTKNHIVCEKEFKRIGCDVKIATDDGSRGFKGRVTELLEIELASSYRLQASCLKPAACSLQPAAMIYACGPRPMLKEISVLSRRYDIPAQISLEEHMACGIGACLGCAVKRTTHNAQRTTQFDYARVCKEGPVFNADEIIW